ncbi:hypothetical protein RDI58_024529 [Solanum bulbocastanum]|uniref:Uncharacterized protein n=1 Tax=Solanum bulbocastanum TaxID=147425 RepID=A0AAN8T3G4_SOLBU
MALKYLPSFLLLNSTQTFIPILGSFILSSMLLPFVPSLGAFNFDVVVYLQERTGLFCYWHDPGTGGSCGNTIWLLLGLAYM